jgi:type VI secretion system protein ImpL
MTMTPTWWPYALAGVLLLALLIVILLVSLLRKASKASQFSDAAEPEPADDEKTPPKKADRSETVGIAGAFRRAAQHLKETGHRKDDNVPLFLLVGAELSRDADLLGSARVDLPFGTPEEAGMSLGEGRGFWFFDRGIVLDVAGEMVLRADGSTSDERGWSAVLGQLRQLRPRRPLDGAIITVAVSDLIDAESNERSRAEFSARMNRIHRKLIEVQKELGFRVPCYVTITGCERLTGFNSLCASLPSASREQMLGWSSPYSIDSAYRTTWSDEAVAACTARLDEVQLEIFADGTSDAASLLGFPNAVRGLAASLRVCLDQLFRTSAYHGALIMRGLYFCGREADAGRQHAFSAPARAEMAFLRELIEQKVFAEHALARPTAGLITQRQRAVRIAQVTAAALLVIFGLGLFHGYRRLTHQNEVVMPFLRHSEGMRAATQQVHGQAVTADTRLDAPAREVLDDMARIDFTYYGTLFIPSSWFSPLRKRVEASVENAFHDVVLEALRADLAEEAETLTRGKGSFEIVEMTTPAAVAEATPPLVDSTDTGVAESSPRMLGTVAPIRSVASMPELHRLAEYVRNVTAFEDAVHTFNRIAAPDAGDLKDLGIVVKHAFDKDLPRKFYNETDLYAHALKHVTAAPFDVSPYREGAAVQAQQLARDLYGALYGGNSFAKELQLLSLRMHQASSQWPTPVDASTFVELAQREREIEMQLARPELEWAFRSDLDLGPEFHALLAQMERSELLGRPVVERIRSEGREGLFQFQRGLASTTSPITGPLLAVDRNGRLQMQLSPDALLLKSAVESFVGEGFVANGANGRNIAASVPEGMRLQWDPRLLEQATGVSQAYDRFRSKSLDIFPVDLRGSVDSVARQRAEARMTDLVAQAQTYAPIAPSVSATTLEEQLRWDIGSFTATVQPVLDNLDAFTRQGSSEQRRAIANATSAEALRLLRAVDRLLEVDGPYRPRQAGFAWWDGTVPPSPAAWGGREPADVNAYVELTRARITVLARNYAQPLLAWFTKAGTRDEPDARNLAAKWQGILDDLRDYDAKKPGNSLTALEEYIVAQMPKVALANCSAARAPSLRSNSFFALAVQDLSTQLSNRCFALAGTNANERYAELSRYFNQRLAGRYPFTDAPPRASEREADPEDVRGFFHLFDGGQALVKSMPDDSAPWVPGARKFIDDMMSVRRFFAPFLDAEKPVPAPSFDVEAAFRIVREREIDGDQIIAWTLTVGDQTLTHRDKAKKLRWTVGDPLRLSLRWAGDAPRVPVLPQPRRGASVTDRTLVYEYANQWSLLTALLENRATPDLLPEYADLQPVTLALSILTQPANEQTTADATSTGAGAVEASRVFLRVTPLAPGTNQPLEPPRFPTRAPRSDGVVAPVKETA